MPLYIIVTAILLGRTGKLPGPNLGLMLLGMAGLSPVHLLLRSRMGV